MENKADQLENYTLLYVEDDLQTQKIFTEILEPIVKHLYTASNGKEGLEVYEQNNPDIVLTDIHMPILNGIEMAKKIKEIKPAQPIIALTAHGETEYLQKAIEIGIDRYILKPVTNLELVYNTLESIAINLSEKEELERLKSAQQVQDKLSATTSMIQNIAHQWRQPLGSITANTNKILLKLELGKELSKDELISSMKSIENNTATLSKIIDDFKNFFKADMVMKRPFEIQHSVQNLIDMFAEQSKEHNIEFIIQSEELTLNQNENQLLQSMRNIIQNCIDSHIVNNTEHEKLIFIKINIVSNYLNIEILDNAGGIADEIMQNIFEPYATTKHNAFGTGLGLYLVNKIITVNFAGHIYVSNLEYTYKNKDYKGAQFILKIPLSEEI